MDHCAPSTRHATTTITSTSPLLQAIVLLSELESEMARLKSLNKAVKTRLAERAAAETELGELQQSTRALEEAIRSRDERLSLLRSEFDSKTGSADRTALALRQELSALEQQVAEARQARADGEIRRQELLEMVRVGERGRLGQCALDALRTHRTRAPRMPPHPLNLHRAPSHLAEGARRRAAQRRHGRHDSLRQDAAGGRRQVPHLAFQEGLGGRCRQHLGGS